MTALLEAIIGVRAPSAGSITLDGVRIDTLEPAERIARGIAFVPEDRQAAALFPALSVCANLSVSSLGRFCRGPWVSHRAERTAAEATAADVGIRPPDVELNIQALSGGNQQKTVIGRALLMAPPVLVLDEPTRGVDVGAKAEIHALIRKLAGEGMSVILGSSDVHDIRSTAHRVVTLSRVAVEVERWRRDAGPAVPRADDPLLAVLLVVFSSLSPAFLTTANLTILVKHRRADGDLAVG